MLWLEPSIALSEKLVGFLYPSWSKKANGNNTEKHLNSNLKIFKSLLIIQIKQMPPKKKRLFGFFVLF